MNNFTNFSRRFALVLLLSFAGFMTGAFAGAYFISGKFGFEGSSQVFTCGLIGLGVGFIASLVISAKAGTKSIGRWLWFAGLLGIFGAGWLTIRFFDVGKDPGSSFEQSPVTEEVELGALTDSTVASSANEISATLLGMGIAQPAITTGDPLYFYSVAELNKMPQDLRPVDSITFLQETGYHEIATAPPWLAPEALKMDDHIFFMQVKSLSKNWVEVLVNKSNGQTAWMARSQIEFIDWPEFLLDLPAVEIVDVEANPVRVKPLDEASQVVQFSTIGILSPVVVQGDWVQVSTANDGNRPLGWVRWRRDGKLLVRLSYFNWKQ